VVYSVTQTHFTSLAIVYSIAFFVIYSGRSLSTNA
jgi:hypothetical protein